MYEPSLNTLITAALARLQADMQAAAPGMAAQVSAWMQGLAGGAEPAAYFMHPAAFPSLLLPWWLEGSLTTQPDLAFQADLAYSTINGYYAIRLADNLMDGHATVELQLLPALNFFQTQFQQAYYPYFPAGHPFWDFFDRTWFHSAEVTLLDARLTGLDLTQFETIAAQKTCAAKIPLAAVCYCYQRTDLLPAWSRLVDSLGCWHQFLNDVFGWQRDLERHTATYFLSEAERRRQEDESVLAWVVREGFAWGMTQAQGWMVALQALADELDSPELADYLHSRAAMVRQQQEDVSAGLQSMAKILTITQ
ncbi:MAG: hypothetical protein U0401_26115 [Anaerolineae bacterium]